MRRVRKVLVGQRQVYLGFNSIKMGFDLLDPMVQLVKAPFNLLLERSLQRIVESEEQLISQTVQCSSIYTRSRSTWTRSSAWTWLSVGLYFLITAPEVED